MEERLDERQMGLVGVPLSMFENASDSDSDGDMVDPDLFMQQLDAETSGALPRGLSKIMLIYLLIS